MRSYNQIQFLLVVIKCVIIDASHEKVVVDNFGGNCNRDSLAVYKVELEGHWSERVFPKHFPKFRPHAHFSKTFGVSHAGNFKLYEIGELASAGLQDFCTTGVSNDFDNELNDSVFDEFSIPKLLNPELKVESRLFVNSNFTFASLVTKLMPSPDWLIGLQSLNLCRNDRWVEFASIEARPLDCGVNSGLTFSAPIFKTTPQDEITEIKANFPNHDASSFYYVDKKNLPAIAYYRFQKIKEYVGVKETSVRRIHQKYRRHDQHSHRRRQRRRNNRNDPRKSLLSSNENETLLTNAIDDPRNVSPDCILSEWNEWSACSTGFCGIGSMLRNRTIIKLNKKGGIPCGQLTERKWCGSERCKDNLENSPISNSSYFRW